MVATETGSPSGLVAGSLAGLLNSSRQTNGDPWQVNRAFLSLAVGEALLGTGGAISKV